MSKKILNKVKQWLKEEVEDNQDVVDAKDNNEAEICSDGTFCGLAWKARQKHRNIVERVAATMGSCGR